MKIKPSLISFVAISVRRKQALLLLKERTMSQPEIRKLTGMYKTHTSRTLSELTKNKLVICRNPEDRVFRFYKITLLGKKVVEELERILEIKK